MGLGFKSTFLPAFRPSRTGPSNFFDVHSGGLLWVGTSMSLFLLVTSVPGLNPPPNLLLVTFRPSLFPDVLSPMLVLILLVFCQWMVVDRFSKAVHLVSLFRFPSAKRMAKLFLGHVIWLHGFTKDIVFDMRPQFGSWRLSATWLGPLPVSHWTLVIRAEGFSIVIGLCMVLGSVHWWRPALSWTPLSSEISITIILDGQAWVRWPRGLGLKVRSTHLFFTQTLFPSCKELLPLSATAHLRCQCYPALFISPSWFRLQITRYTASKTAFSMPGFTKVTASLFQPIASLCRIWVWASTLHGSTCLLRIIRACFPDHDTSTSLLLLFGPNDRHFEGLA